MNRLGVLIDLSHCGDRTTMEAIELSARPVAITHSNPREYVGTPGFGPGRLKTTEAIRLLAARGGVLGLSPNPHLTKEAAAGTRDRSVTWWPGPSTASASTTSGSAPTTAPAIRP